MEHFTENGFLPEISVNLHLKQNVSMTLKERIDAFSELGILMRDALDGKPGNHAEELAGIIARQQFRNQWFTPEYVRLAISSIANELTTGNLEKWTSAYRMPESPEVPLKVAVIMAGNIPLVGFHDFLSVLITGNTILAKLSSKDEELITALGTILAKINPGFGGRISFVKDRLSGFDAVIATGSNNSSRYFEFYFGKYPHIIRKSRNSLAVIKGNETGEELTLLGRDIFSYFGLGCRSISKVFLPRGYDIQALAGHWAEYSRLMDHSKYANNYDFHKAVYLINKELFIDTGFLLMKVSRDLASPVAVLNYEFYESLEKVDHLISSDRDRIQCITGHKYTPFGMSQSPKLWDYADGIDTVEFLLKKKCSVIL